MDNKQIYTIKLAESHDEFLCGNDQTVLNAMTALGRSSIPSGCHGGGCGVCKVEVLEGEYTTLPMSRQHVSELEEKKGQALACRVFPTTGLTLKPIGKFRKKVYAFNAASK